MSIIEHNSRSLFYRSPFGAVTTGTEVKLSIAVNNVGIPAGVKVVYMNDKERNVVNMPYVMSIDGHSIYEVKIKMPQDVGLIWYYFKLETSQGTVFYGNNEDGLGGIGKIYYEEPRKSFQITVYNSHYKTPDWFKQSVAYQIFVDRFYNGNEDGSFLNERDDIIKRDWNDTPFYKAEQFGGKYLANDFFGGNLKGIIKKLPYLKELGINVIYLNPIFQAYSNHKYDTGDYKTIDPMFGDEKTFCELMETARKMSIKVILDGVFNHTGSDSKYFNKYGKYDSVGAYQSKDSPYYSWYKFMQYPEVYESWWGMTTLPHVDETSDSYRKYVLSDRDSVVKHWIKKGTSGWRLDVVDELPGFFVKELRTQIKKQNKDAVIIGEVWEDASNKCSYGERREYFLGDELDSVMNYPLRNALIDFALNNIDASGFDRRIMSLKENYPKQAFNCLLNIISTHDVERAITILGNAPSANSISKDEQANFSLNGQQLELAKRRLKQVVAMQILLPGVPCIYYGDEIGMQGYADPFCRKGFAWGEEDTELLDWYKQIIQIRNDSDAFKKGEFETVFKVDNIYGFTRVHKSERYIVIINTGQFNNNARVDLGRFGIKKITSILNDEVQDRDDGIFYIDTPHGSVKIFRTYKL